VREGGEAVVVTKETITSPSDPGAGEKKEMKPGNETSAPPSEKADPKVASPEPIKKTPIPESVPKSEKPEAPEPEAKPLVPAPAKK